MLEVSSKCRLIHNRLFTSFYIAFFGHIDPNIYKAVFFNVNGILTQ